MKKLLLLIFITIVNTSCNDVEFVFKNQENLLNPLYEKTVVSTSGKDLSYMNSYLPMFFGKEKENNFRLEIEIEEEKTKRSVKKNQAVSNIRYELRFLYLLFSNEKNCTIYQKKIVSHFSVLPKSSGYNYGSDASLERKYELAINENLNKFLSLLRNIDLQSCS